MEVDGVDAPIATIPEISTAPYSLGGYPADWVSPSEGMAGRCPWPPGSSGKREGLIPFRGYSNVASVSSTVTVFWRPGCRYCWRLRRKLKRSGVQVDEVNIWEDLAGAAFVRSITGGDETVPTVRIGTQSVVNPSPRRVLEMIREIDGE